MTTASSTAQPGTACFPGSFSPPTIAHLAISEAALAAPGIDRVHWVVSVVALAKESVTIPYLDDRIAVLEAVADGREWLSVQVTEAQLIADIAAGYDAVVLGADKWIQIHDVAFYDHDPVARDRAVGSLPRPLLVPRHGHELPADAGHHVLDVHERHLYVSSTRARAGDRELMLDEARSFDNATGAWTDRSLYLARRSADRPASTAEENRP